MMQVIRALSGAAPRRCWRRGVTAPVWSPGRRSARPLPVRPRRPPRPHQLHRLTSSTHSSATPAPGAARLTAGRARHRRPAARFTIGHSATARLTLHCLATTQLSGWRW